MKRKITDNLGLKILAVFCSVALWLIVMNLEDPIGRRIFNDIPVKILNGDAVTSQGKVFEVLDGTDTINVTVYAKKSALNNISRENIVATADMQELTFMETVRIELSTNENSAGVERIQADTENLKVDVEDLKRIQMVVETTTIGEPASGYLLGDISTDQNLVRLSGPESLISKVDKAVVEVSVEGMSTGIQANYPIKLYDEQDREIDDKSITKSINSIYVTANILQKKQIPLIFSSTGTPADGYEATGQITGNPEVITVAGKSSALKNLTGITIPPEVLDITGQSADYQIVVDLKQYLPDNVSLADNGFNGKVSVTVYIEKRESATLNVDKKNIVIQNTPENKKVEIADMDAPAPVKVEGLSEYMAGINNLALSGYIDMNAVLQKAGVTELTDGNYQAEVTFNLPSGLELSEPFKVTLSVSQLEGEEEE